ncbi:hypothetical protein V8B97DRAFT_1877531, partial [Scleroderma yunnanense]
IRDAGLASNPGFSSTTGVQISMANFNELKYKKNKEGHERQPKPLRIGAGCILAEVAEEMREDGYFIVDSSPDLRVGVAGWLLGGGYSLYTNEYGLGIDNLLEVEIVLPSGEIRTASAKENPDLFFAVKGGGNNFGIVTSFTVTAYPRNAKPKEELYNRWLAFSMDESAKVKGEIIKFTEECTDRKASVAGVYCYHRGLNNLMYPLVVLLFYNDKEAPQDMFKGFLDLVEPERSKSDRDTISSFAEMVQVCTHAPKFPLGVGHGRCPTAAEESFRGKRIRVGNVMLSQCTHAFLDRIEEIFKISSWEIESEPSKQGLALFIHVWPFMTFVADNDSAWPHKTGQKNYPLIVILKWDEEKNDEHWVNFMQRLIQSLRNAANQEGCTSAELPVDPNTAFAGDTDASAIYQQNYDRLVHIRRDIDPHNVMDRTGGFRIGVK